MRRLIGATLWVTGLGAASLGLGWTDPFHLTCLLGMLILPALLALWFWHHRGEEELDDDETDSVPLARTLLSQVILIALCVGYAQLGMTLIHAAGYGINVTDRDREAFEMNLAALEEAGNYEKAATLIRERVEKPVTVSWKQLLVQRQYQNLLKVGKESSSVESRKQRFSEAIQIAQMNGLDESIAASLLEECVREEQFITRLAEFQSKRDWTSRATLLEANLLEPGSFRTRFPLSEWLRDTFLDWANDQSDAASKRNKLVKALEVAEKGRLDASRVLLELERLDRTEGDKARPRDLVHGSKGGILNVICDFSPAVVIADFWLDWPNDAPVEGLTAKDVRLFWAGNPVSKFELRELRGKAVPLHVSIVVDVSGSMKPALGNAQKGAKELIGGLSVLRHFHPEIAVEVLCFNDRVVRRCGWTKDLEKAQLSLDGLHADGGTALLKAVELALFDLNEKPGKRHLLVFTDGKDTEGGPGLVELIGRAKGANTTVSSIGLRTDDLDSKTLKSLALETGGHYWEAAASNDLVASFQRAALGFRPHFYRLVFSPPETSLGPLEIRVGGENSLLLTGK